MVGVGQPGDFLVGQFPMHAVDQHAQLAGVDEQRLAARSRKPSPRPSEGRSCPPSPEGSGLLIAGDEPEADGNLRGVEQLAGQGHHAIDQIGLDDGLADLALARLVGTHRAVGQDEARVARWGPGGG